MKKIIVIVGPTGVGKTKLSIELAKKSNGEVINADSTQVYKGLDIATAKVREEEKEGIPHHLFDIKDVKEDYTVYNYQQDARRIIDEIYSRNKLPIMVGGTGLYIKAALYDYDLNEEENSNYIDLNKSTDDLYQELIKIDKNTDIHPHNRKRIIRSLNYYYENNKTLSSKEKTNTLLYDAIFIGLTTDRELLYDRINRRVDIMVQDGLLEEAKKIYDSNIRTKAIMTPIGYKELFPYFEKESSLDECLDKIKQNSRHYAKRQYTWNRHQFDVKWFDVDFDGFNNTVEKVIEYIEKDVKN